MTTYFISDLHLKAAHRQVSDGFVEFLQTHILQAEALYILGDFFDAWIGDDDDDPFVAEIKQALKGVTAAGVAVYFIHGNRDFLIGQAFASETGVTLLDQLTTIELYGVPCLIMHGDTLCTEDLEYVKFRQMVHSPQWQQQVLALPLPQRRQMAADLRAKSQSLNAIKAADIMDVTQAEVAKTMRTAQVPLLIHGHTHRPKIHTLELDNGAVKRMVLGDWHATGWYIKARCADDIQLVEFPMGQS